MEAPIGIVTNENSLGITPEKVCLELTGFNLEQAKELREKLTKDHLDLHEKYHLPSDDLMKPGKQQEYVDQMISSIDSRGIKINWDRKDIPTPAQYNPEYFEFSSRQPDGSKGKEFHGEIAVNPTKIDTHDGVQVSVILGHEFVHSQQETPTNVETVVKNEYDAYVASEIIDGKSDRDIQNIFSRIVSSTSQKCVVAEKQN